MWPAPEPVAERWLLQRVADERVLARAEWVITVTSGASALEAARLMQEQDVHQLLVIDGGRLVGAADG
jgi:predicted transcriptional regulator